MGFFFDITNEVQNNEIIGYADASYLSGLHKAISQTWYLFMYRGTFISLHSTKQTLVAMTYKHAELITLYEARREFVRLRSFIHCVKADCGIISDKQSPTVIYEDNVVCIAQIKEWYIKGDKTKQIFLEFFL